MADYPKHDATISKFKLIYFYNYIIENIRYVERDIETKAANHILYLL